MQIFLFSGLLAISITLVNAEFDFALCKLQVQNGTFGFDGALTANGTQATNQSLIEAYSYTSCINNCGKGSDFNSYKTFSEQASLWFLPWFLLVAQIPCFTSSKLGDVLVMIVSVGSPTMALYNLFLTIMDRAWLREYCKRQLPSQAQGTNDQVLIRYIRQVMNSLHQFPLELVNMPVRLLEQPLPDKTWWADLSKWFIARRRHMEVSAYAQLFLTVTVYCFTTLPLAFAALGGILSLL